MRTLIEKISNRILNLEKLKQDSYNLLSKLNYEDIENLEKDSKNRTNFDLKIKNLKDLKMAVIMDEFTLACYMPECNIFEITPNRWKNEIEEFKPHIVFVESAWKGKDGLWERKIANGSSEFFQMATYCQDKNIPIVFWNKEDPVYTDTFMNVAKMADFVFTTDIDCIDKYKANLEHDNVYHLHFAAQPKIHNPIEKFERKDKFCFAGAYYHRYPLRTKVFDAFANNFINTKGFDIYDRNLGNARAEHAFPKSYNKYILGKLNPDEIDIAYKGYNFGVNMNSVNQSQTMFARRLFEMLASNTITVGNYSRGVKNYFGDLTICTDDEETLSKELLRYCKDEESSHKYRLQGLRKVLTDHLYEDRLSYVVEKVFGKNLKLELPQVLLLSKVENESDLNYIIETFEKQSYENTKLIIISDLNINISNKYIKTINIEESEDKKIADIFDEGYISLLNPEDYYGENYILDLVQTCRYKYYEGIGKSNHYTNNTGEIELNNNDSLYKNVKKLIASRSIINTELCREFMISEYIKNPTIENNELFSIDEFNYCENYVGKKCEKVDDIFIADKGISLDNIINISENIKSIVMNDDILKLDANTIKETKVPINIPVEIQKQGNKVNIISKLEEEKHSYMYIEKLWEIKGYLEEDNLPILFNGIGALDLICVCIFYDKNKEKIAPLYPKLNRLEKLQVPQNAYYVKFGFRPKGKGIATISNIILGNNTDNEKSCFLSRSNTLVLTNQYPSAENLYRNMFVHKRMTSYKEEGYTFDIMRMNTYAKDGFREFDGINIVEGQSDTLYSILESGNIETVCVHFLDKEMWNVLKQFKDKIRIIVWSHGSDIYPWWRREFNFNTKEDLEKGKDLSDEKMKLWSSIFKYIDNYDIHFVYVSQNFANEVFEDYKISLPKERYSIIHNCIDTEMFKYNSKCFEQRKKIASIRPYASNKYANDLSVKAILELSKKDYFNELDIMMAGSGELFEETLKPLKKFKNVKIVNGFFRQEEMYNIYKDMGILLIPTRNDTQGVSRDEAMSCGVIPVTNAVTAIPEFVDETCGILAPGEDYIEMAKGIDMLYNNPDKFLEMSENAAKRVRMQTSKEFTIDKEIDIIMNRNL